MIIGIIGSGGREHSICSSLNKSKIVKKIFCFPGNAGTENIATNIKINLNNFNELKNFIFKEKIKMIVVGPEKPLVDGIVNFLEKNNIKVFGPNKIASQLEGSKIFTKKLCEKYKIPTAKFGIFENSKEANDYLEKTKFPLVVKADGLASGKGVYICENRNQAITAIEEIFKGKFGVAKNILIEEFLQGEEMSYFLISDGKTIKKFQTAQDHKRALEGDKGKNTGGMGAYSPSRLLNNELDKKIMTKIINPTIKGLQDFGCNYKGFLYAGLIIIDNEPYLIEYNVRMGDPECQTILPRLKSDLFDIINSCCSGNLSNTKIEWYKEKSLCIVLCSKGYPDNYENNILIENIDQIDLGKNDYCYHAGTIKKGGLIHKLNWSNGFYRKDIGYKVIDQ